MAELTIYDISLDKHRPATQDDIDSMQRTLTKFAVMPRALIDKKTDQSFTFKLAIYPNRMRDDGVFVAEEKEIEPYPGILNSVGKPCYPSVPNTPWSIGSQLPHAFAAELVRRWNAHAPTNYEDKS